MCIWHFWLRISSGIKSRSIDLNSLDILYRRPNKSKQLLYWHADNRQLVLLVLGVEFQPLSRPNHLCFPSLRWHSTPTDFQHHSAIVCEMMNYCKRQSHRSRCPCVNFLLWRSILAWKYEGMSEHNHAVCQKQKHQIYMVGSGGKCHRATSGVVQSSDLWPLSEFELHLVDLLV